jgi:hypothetical protein
LAASTSAFTASSGEPYVAWALLEELAAWAPPAQMKTAARAAARIAGSGLIDPGVRFGRWLMENLFRQEFNIAVVLA